MYSAAGGKVLERDHWGVGVVSVSDGNRVDDQLGGSRPLAAACAHDDAGYCNGPG